MNALVYNTNRGGSGKAWTQSGVRPAPKKIGCGALLLWLAMMLIGLMLVVAVVYALVNGADVSPTSLPEISVKDGLQFIGSYVK